MFVQVKDYFAVLFRLEQKSPFLKKHLKSDTVKLDIYCQGMNKSGVLLIRFYYSKKKFRIRTNAMLYLTITGVLE